MEPEEGKMIDGARTRRVRGMAPGEGKMIDGARRG